MRFGRFDDDAREYVVEDMKTPVKWINYVGDLRFGGFIDHTGGMLLCKGDPALNRITKYIPQLPSSNLKGHTIYLRLREEEGMRTLAPLFVPKLEKLDRYECGVGLGYSRFVSEIAGVRTEMTMFVPRDSFVLVEDVTLTNISDKPLTVDAIPFVEYSHFDAVKQFMNADWVPQTMQSKAHDAGDGRKFLAQYAFMNRDSQQTYLTATVPASSFESDRARFLGENEYGTYADPGCLKQAELSKNARLRKRLQKLRESSRKLLGIHKVAPEPTFDDKLDALFARYDTDHNNLIDADELVKLLEHFIPPHVRRGKRPGWPSLADAHFILGEVDIDGDEQTISREELRAAVNLWRRLIAETTPSQADQLRMHGRMGFCCEVM